MDWAFLEGRRGCQVPVDDWTRGIRYTDEDGLVLAGDEDIVFFEDGHAVVSENGHHAVVGSLAYAHE